MKYQLTADYHTHTYRSDGHGTIEGNIQEAIKKGIKTLAITDHGPFHNKKSRCPFDYQLINKFELKKLQKKYPQIKLLSGIEANLISLRGDLDITKHQQQAFDIIVMGQHKTPHGLKFWDNISWRLRNFFPTNKWRREKVTKAYLKAMENNKITILAHLNRYIKANIKPIAEMAAKKNILIELNGKRVDLTQSEIDDCVKAGVKFVISSDAHYSERVGDPKAVWEFLETHNVPKDRIVNIMGEPIIN
ncbi:MAG: PHP domain-containing protein [Clostridia bacterium]|nr:PHP domain-containing protein [Clostridia bacterium]